MTLAFLNLGFPELILVGGLGLLLIIAIGNYGRNTALGYTGSIILAIFSTPIVAFLIISIIKGRENKRKSY